MPVDRFYLSKPLEKNSHVTLEGQEFEHLQKVTRHSSGDIVEIVNGKGELAQARVDKILKKEAVLTIVDVHKQEKTRPEIILAQAITKLAKLELLIEKSVELNVSEICLFPGVRSDKVEFSQNQMKRLEYILVSAMKQCGRLDLPSLSYQSSLLEIFPIKGTGFYGDVSAHARPLLQSLQTAILPITLFIGPEGGFDEKEVQLFQKENIGPISLIDTTLRAETAAISSVAIISHFLYSRRSHDL